MRLAFFIALFALAIGSWAQRPIVKGSTDQSVVIRIIDSAAGTPETGVEHNTSGIDMEYRRDGAASVDITEAALAAADSAHSDGGIEHLGNGYYRLDLPDAAVATGVNGVLVHGTVTDMIVVGVYVPLVGIDIYAAQIAANVTQIEGGDATDALDTAADTVTVTSIGSGVITATAIATDAIGADEIAANAIGASEVASGAIVAGTEATGFSTHSAADVWAVGTRVLTAGTNLSFSTHSAADVWAVGTRVLTAGTNLSFSTHSAADVWSAGTRTLTALDEDATTIDLNASLVGGIAGTLTTLDALDTAQDSQHATTQGAVDAVDNFVDTEIAAIVSALSTIDGIVDDILIDTGTSLVALLTTLDTNVDAILVDTAVIGAAGAGLSAIPWNASWDAEAQSEVADALTAYDPPTRTEATSDKDAILTRLGTPADTDIATDIANIEAGSGGDATAANQTTIIGHLTGIKGSTFDTATDSLEAIRNRGDSAWVTGEGGTAGPGGDVCTQEITSNGVPISGAAVWVSTDALGSNVVAGTALTNDAGEVQFMLDDGLTYYLWMRKAGQNPILGEAFVAEAD